MKKNGTTGITLSMSGGAFCRPLYALVILRAYDDEFKTPVFLTAKNLKPYIPNNLLENSRPILFEMEKQQYIGYKAELLPETCGVFIDALEYATNPIRLFSSLTI